MTNTIKIIFLGLLGFFTLIYFTAQKPRNIDSKIAKNYLSYDKLPNDFSIISSNNFNKVVSKKELIKKDTYLIIASYDAMIILKDIKKYLNISSNYILVPNISDTTWAMKKLFVESKLEELKRSSNNIIIYDESSKLSKLLNIYSTKNKFFIYKLAEDMNLSLVYKSGIKENLYEKKLDDKQLMEILAPLEKVFK